MTFPYRCAITPDATIGRDYPLVSLHPEAERPDKGVRLRYLNATFSSPWEGALSNTVLSHTEARQLGYALRDRDGRECVNSGWDYLRLVDVGNPDYIDLAVERSRELVAGYDGIHLDDVNPTWRTTRPPAEYRNLREWQGAMAEFLHAFTRRVGVPVYANIGWQWDYDLACRHLAGQMNGGGVIKEHWMKWLDPKQPSAGYSDSRPDESGMWDLQIKYADYVLGRGLDLVGITSGVTGDGRAAMYGLASMLLVDNGHTFWTLGGSSYAHDTWLPVLDQAAYLGKPVGTRRLNQAGNWQRQFEGGTVVVNASTRRRGVLAPMHARIVL